jgi:hypothetical protein
MKLVLYSLLLTFVGVQADRLKEHASQVYPRQCTIDDAWPTGPGNALQPQQVTNQLQSMLNQVNTTNIEAIIQKLVSFGTRHTASSQTDPVRGIGE